MKVMLMKKSRSEKTSISPVRRTLADDACPSCGTGMLERRSQLKLPLNGENVSVPSALHMSCPKCGEVVLRFEDSRRLQEDAIAIYRKKHGLLSASQIRAIRERFGLTQGEFGRLLHLGANTISRWESGRNVQTESMEMLLRLIRDLPGSLDYLRRHAA
jgi:putative zinc finger/helix-turn-helix YgiT family protein